MVVDSVIKLRIKPSTRAKVRDIVQSALGSNSLTPTEAGSLCGKLRWVFSLGRIGLGALSVIKARQYAGTPAGSGGSWALDEGLRMAFVVILDIMAEDGEEFPSVIHCSLVPRRLVLVWTDASWDPAEGRPFGEGQLGYVVKAQRQDGRFDVFFAASEPPDEVLRRRSELRVQKTFIHPLELIGMLAPYFSARLAPLFKGADVLHFGDNMAANGAARKGFSGSADLNLLAHKLMLRNARSDTRLWIEHVRSKPNIADAPSRMTCDPEAWAIVGRLVRDHGAVQVSFEWPDIFEGLSV